MAKFTQRKCKLVKMTIITMLKEIKEKTFKVHCKFHEKENRRAIDEWERK